MRPEVSGSARGENQSWDLTSHEANIIFRTEAHDPGGNGYLNIEEWLYAADLVRGESVAVDRRRSSGEALSVVRAPA